VLIKKFGTNGTHLKDMENARSRLSMPRIVPEAGEPVLAPKEEEPAADSSPTNESANDTPSTDSDSKTTVDTEAPESPADESVAAKAPADAAVSDSTEKKEEPTE
jgi:hypothetical protein